MRRNIPFVQYLVTDNNNSLSMDVNQILPGLPHPFLYEPISHPPYFYAQQSQPYTITPMEMNMIYLMQQNMLLQEQLNRQRQQTHDEELQAQRPKFENIKIEDVHHSESGLSSGYFRGEEHKHVLQTQTSIKQNCNRKKKIRRIKGEKNQTKNIPKSYGKAIILFIESNRELVRRVVQKFPSMTFTSFMTLLRSKKKRISSIADLRAFWLEAQEPDFPKIARILSNVFLRNYSLQYIFNSRISNYAGHVKYRGRLVEALKNPNHFTSIKQY